MTPVFRDADVIEARYLAAPLVRGLGPRMSHSPAATDEIIGSVRGIRYALA